MLIWPSVGVEQRDPKLVELLRKEESVKRDEFVRMDMSETVEPIIKDESLSRAKLVSEVESFRRVEPMWGEWAFPSWLGGQWDIETTLFTVPYLSSSSGECCWFNIQDSCYSIKHRLVFAPAFVLSCSSPQLMSPVL